MRKFLIAVIAAAVFATLLVPGPAAAQSAAPTCPADVEDPDGDGWGWIESTRTSCRMPGGEQPSDVCVDSDGDGWGWNEATQQSCRMPCEQVNTTCVDSDGDGWGWDGQASCRVDAVATVSNAPLGRFELVAQYRGPVDGYQSYEATWLINVEQGKRWPVGCRNPGLGVIDRDVVWDDIRDLRQQSSPGCDELRDLLNSTASLVAPTVFVTSVYSSLGVANLNWSQVRGADRYVISELPKTADSRVTETDGYWFTATNLRRGQTYAYEVAAIRDDEIGPPATVQFTTMASEPNVPANLDETPEWATFATALVAVAATSAASGVPPNLLQEVLREWVSQELANYIAGLYPGCLPPWVDGLIGIIIASVSAGDSPPQTLLKLAVFAQTIDFEDLGSCESPVPNAETPTECSDPGIAPLNASEGTEFCAEDGVIIYRHQAGLWVVKGTNEVRQMDNDGVGQGLVEVPAAAQFIVPIAAFVFALGGGFALTMQSVDFDGVVVAADGVPRRYATAEAAWQQFPDRYFDELSAEQISEDFTVRATSGAYVEYVNMGRILPRVRLAVRADDTAVLQYRQGFFDWFETDREYEVLRGGPSGNAIVEFDSIDTTDRGLERRTAGLPAALTTTSSRARSHVLTDEHDDGRWQAHHLLPVNVILTYDDMFIDAIGEGVEDEILTGIYLTDAAHNLIMLPADVPTQRRHYQTTVPPSCLPIHNGYSIKHMNWDYFAEFGFYDQDQGRNQKGVYDLFLDWQQGGRSWGTLQWVNWSFEIYQLQSAMERLIKADIVGEPGCFR